MNNQNKKSSSMTWNPTPQENICDVQHKHNVEHSTHAYCETFDQATRDLQQSSQSNLNADANKPMSTGYHSRSATKDQPVNESEQALKNANSAVQLDRDTDKSRRHSDPSLNQQSSTRGDGRSWITNRYELPYVE
ncbi:hypothetical protein FBU30_004593 [Linnemannia zychae]|nr:hypothetical protein FBU30_004593 [Linnemannia zychae]